MHVSSPVDYLQQLQKFETQPVDTDHVLLNEILSEIFAAKVLLNSPPKQPRNVKVLVGG